MHGIYRRKNARETKQRPRPETKPTRARHVFEALNDWQLEESPINDFPAFLDQKIVSQ